LSQDFARTTGGMVETDADLVPDSGSAARQPAAHTPSVGF
jgi:hypothetical protein